jgi:hypothetical protein
MEWTGTGVLHTPKGLAILFTGEVFLFCFLFFDGSGV